MGNQGNSHSVGANIKFCSAQISRIFYAVSNRFAETHDDALHREIREEVGYECEVLEHIADVHDYYNLINRKNYNYFYLVKRLGKVEQRLEPDEVIRIEKIIWVPIDEAIKLYENMQNVLVGKIVKQRELPILKLAKEILLKRTHE